MPPDRRRTPSSRRAVIVLALLVAGVASACAGDAASGPTLPSMNFEPKLVVHLDDQITFTAGPREDPSVTTDPASVPAGTAIEVVNDGDSAQRLQGGRGGSVFDTGVMLPGEQTTVVLANGTEADTVVALTTTESPDLSAEIIVRSRTS